MTLKGTVDIQTELGAPSPSGPTRRELFFSQLEDMDAHIAVIQETRLRNCRRHHDEKFLIFSSGVNARGHGGVLLSCSCLRPYGVLHDAFSATFHPRFLVVKMKAPGLQRLVIGDQAPHHCESAQVISDWWNALPNAIPNCYDTWPWALLASHRHLGR